MYSRNYGNRLANRLNQIFSLGNCLIGALISTLLLFCSPAFALDGSVLKWIEPRTRAEAPQTIQLPQEWVKALDDIWDESERRGIELAMCLDIAPEKSTVDQRRQAAENLRGLRREQDALPDKENNEPKELQERRRHIQSQIDQARSEISQTTAAAVRSMNYRQAYKVYGEGDQVKIPQEHTDREICPIMVHTHPVVSVPSPGDIGVDLFNRTTGLIRGHDDITVSIRPKDTNDKVISEWWFKNNKQFNQSLGGYFNLLNQDLCASNSSSFSATESNEDELELIKFSSGRYLGAVARHLNGYGNLLYHGGRDGKLLLVAPTNCPAPTSTDAVYQNAIAQFQRFALGGSVTAEQLFQEPDPNAPPFIGPSAKEFNSLQITKYVNYPLLGLPPFDPKQLLLNRSTCSGGYSEAPEGGFASKFVGAICTSDLPRMFINGSIGFIEKGRFAEKGKKFQTLYSFTYNKTSDEKSIERVEGGSSLHATFDPKTQKILAFGKGIYTKKYNTNGMLILDGFYQSADGSHFYNGSFAVQNINNVHLSAPWGRGRYRHLDGKRNSWVIYEGNFYRAGVDLLFTGTLKIEKSGEVISQNNMIFIAERFNPKP